MLLEGPKTLTELSDMLELKKPSLLPYLERLQDLGVVAKDQVRTTTGRETRYRLLGASLHLDVSPARGTVLAWAAGGEPDPRFPLLNQVPDPAARASLSRALAAVETALGASLAEAAPFVVLFGSFARGETTWKSDVDLLFVLDKPEDKERIRDALAEAQTDAEHALRGQYTTRDVFQEGRRKLDLEAAAEGMVLAARDGEDALWRRMARSRRIAT